MGKWRATVGEGAHGNAPAAIWRNATRVRAADATRKREWCSPSPGFYSSARRFSKPSPRPAARPARFWGQLGTKFFRLSSHRRRFRPKHAKSIKRRFPYEKAVKTHYLRSVAKASEWIQLPPPPPCIFRICRLRVGYPPYAAIH